MTAAILVVRTFHNPVRVTFGVGALGTLSSTLDGRRFVLLTTAGAARRGVVDRVRDLFCRGRGDALAGVYSEIEPNPTVAGVMRAGAALAGRGAEVVVGVGGGSVLDTAKAVAAQLGSSAPREWLERHLRARGPFPADWAPLPLIAVPTTAGTGSEVTMWATVWDELDQKKYSLSDARLYPSAALVDPELTLSLPEDVTIATGLDALSHSLESIWNKNHNPISDALAMRSISVITRVLPRVLEEPSDLEARSELHAASLGAGLAFSNTRTAIAHSISYPITAHLGLPHGIACSFTLPEVMVVNGEKDARRGRLVAGAFGVSDVLEARERLYQLFQQIGLGRILGACVRDAGAISSVPGSMITPGRADNNLADVSEEGARAIASRAYRRLCGDAAPLRPPP